MVSDNYRQEFDAAKLKTMNSSADIGALFNMLSQVARDVKELKEERRIRTGERESFNCLPVPAKRNIAVSLP